MTDNKKYRIQLEGQYKALDEHLQKLAKEREKPIENQDLGLIAHWEKTVANCHKQIAKLQRRLIKMNTTYKQPIDRLKRHMAEYQPQLKRALEAINILETANPDSDEFCNALAELHVCTTILEPYSEGMLEAIEQFTEDDSILGNG